MCVGWQSRGYGYDRADGAIGVGCATGRRERTDDDGSGVADEHLRGARVRTADNGEVLGGCALSVKGC